MLEPDEIIGGVHNSHTISISALDGYILRGYLPHHLAVWFEPRRASGTPRTNSG